MAATHRLVEQLNDRIPLGKARVVHIHQRQRSADIDPAPSVGTRSCLFELGLQLCDEACDLLFGNTIGQSGDVAPGYESIYGSVGCAPCEFSGSSGVDVR